MLKKSIIKTLFGQQSRQTKKSSQKAILTNIKKYECNYKIT